jgi:beta-lactamase regulating signal transducer with metallopeptidase domain/protein involved in polysaccharide export with SLBB domain
MVPSLSSAALLLSGSLELSLLVKATLLLAVGLIAARLAHRARASVRHLVIATSFIALAALPALMIGVPALTIDVPVASTTLQPADRIAFTPAPIDGAPMAPNVVDRSFPALSPWQWLRLAWIAGVIAFLVPLASALWRLSMIRRTGLPVAWPRSELARLADARGISQPVELLEHEAVPGPMTFGLSRPVIVLPPDAREWPEAELRCALMHEIEHIQRRDWLMQMLARTVAAFYWFHPMVWSAWRRLCLEAERSCDDAVVASEERTDYAEQLVTLAQRMSATPVQPMLGMANRTDLSTRVTAVLDERLHRGRAGFVLAAGTVVAAAFVVGSVAPVRAVAKAEPAVVTADERSSVRALVEAPARALDRTLDDAANAVTSAAVKEVRETGVKPSKNVERLAAPQAPVQNAIESTRAIFVIGEVRNPGKYLIEGEVTLLEVIARAGSLTASAGNVIVVHRFKDTAATGGTPAVPGDPRASEVLRLAIDDLREGRITSSLLLQDGDTVYIPAADRYYVTGYVRSPGAYVLLPKMTVLQAIAIAGGVSERGSTQGIKIIRRVDGKSVEIDVGDDDLVEPNDTIQIPRLQ